MKLDELKQSNKEITKAYLNYMFKSARSAQDDTKGGVPKLNSDGTKKKRAKPLSPDYGERRALRGTPTAKNPLGPIIGSGGAMHSPINPLDAAKELARISDEMRTGQTLPYSQLKDQGDSFDAVTMRNKRSAPGRAAVWPSGAKWDKEGPYYNMNRTVVSPDGTKKVTKSRPATPKATPSAPAQVAPPPKLLVDPEEKRRFLRKLKLRARRSKLARKKVKPPKKIYRKPPMKSGKFYFSGTIDENFGKSLDKALGL